MRRWLFDVEEQRSVQALHIAVQVNERFGGTSREEHVRSLNNCAQSLQSECAALHLRQCQMEGFPSMYHVNRLRHHSSVCILYNPAYSMLCSLDLKLTSRPPGTT